MNLSKYLREERRDRVGERWGRVEQGGEGEENYILVKTVPKDKVSERTRKQIYKLIK